MLLVELSVSHYLLARGLSTVKHAEKDIKTVNTSDADIVRRRWLLLDLDPRRPSGVGSNPRQLASAERLARECRDLLYGAGWPAPVEALSTADSRSATSCSAARMAASIPSHSCCSR